MYLVVIIICLAIILMLVIMLMTDILLDPTTVAAIRPYSLARTQLALWTLIIFCSLIYVWGSRHYLLDSTISLGQTALVLLGISSSVTILGKMIDGADIQNVSRGRSTGRHQDRGRQGFLWDILSDENGVSIHRLQNVLFTVLLMTSFIIDVWQTGEMPEFDKTFLVLSGVSSAAYLGVKMNENR